jgi:restriction endonuclease S subunit
MNINKKNWNFIKLDEILKEISVRIDKPNNSKIEKFVGLNNFISGDIKIKSSISTKKITSSAKQFKSGDILFARRNAYLKRCSYVDFDGCCSGDAFVLRENLDKVLPKFTAFILNSDLLWDYANANAAGTMSKRVKWRDLSQFEILIPSKTEQKKLLKLLNTSDEAFEKSKVLREKLILYKKSFINDLKINCKNKVFLEDIFDINWGDTNITKKSYVEHGYKAFSAKGQDGFLKKYDFDERGIVLSAIGADCGKCFFATEKWSAIKNTITLIPKNNKFNHLELIYEILNDKNFWTINGGAQPFISLASAKKSKICIFDNKIALKNNNILKEISKCLEDSYKNIKINFNLRTNLINKIFDNDI